MSASVIIHELARYVAHRGGDMDVNYSEMPSGGFGAWIRADIPFDMVGGVYVGELIVDCTDGADSTPRIVIGDVDSEGHAEALVWHLQQIWRAFEAAGYTPTDAWTEMMSALEDACQELTRKAETTE